MLRNLSIPTKMVLLACSSAGLALMLMCLGFAWHSISTLLTAKGQQLRDQAQIIAFQAGPAIALGDRPRGEKLLASLQSDVTLEEARLYSTDRRIVATWGEQQSVMAPAISPQGYRYAGLGHVEVFFPVVIGSQRLGAVYLRANTSDVRAQLFEFARIAGAVLGIAMLVVILISMRLQRAISRPILALTKAADDITANGDYSIRVEGNAGAELKRLQDTFNRMLDKIEQSEKQIQAAHDELEERVASRTEELSQEIGRRRAIQKDLETAKDAAEAANRAKTEFLANMSHEIRTPLNGIMGFTELLLPSGDEVAPQEQYEYLTTIHTSGLHLVELINDILDVSKIEAGHFETECIPCSPRQIIMEVVSMLQVRAKEKGLHLDYEVDSAIPAAITSDPSRLRQLLMNLVSNAIKFTEVGGIQILASLTESEPQQLQIEVVDSGVGIPFEKLEQIFDPFTQADTSVTRRFGGTGLGLAISRKISEALGGCLTVQSGVNEGSVFTATVEIGETSDLVLDEPSQLAPSPVALCAPVLPPHARILVVDDGETNRKLIRLILQRAGVDVLCAENGLEAVKLAEQENLSLILMDMQMPIMDGYSATRELVANGCTVPIIALTAHAMKGDADKCAAAGCSGYLTKPIDSTRLLRVVAEQLAGRAGDDSPVESPAQGSVPAAAEPIYSSLPTDDPEFCEIVIEFVERLRNRLVEIRSVQTRQAFGELALHAHWLKGAGGTAGFHELTEPAKALEAAAKAGDAASCDRWVTTLEELTTRIAMPIAPATAVLP